MVASRRYPTLMSRRAPVFATVVLMVAGASAPQVPPPARAELAPTGTLRAGINYGNAILARKNLATGESSGVAIDLARELGRRVGVPVTIVAYDSVGAMVDGAKAGEWTSRSWEAIRRGPRRSPSP